MKVKTLLIGAFVLASAVAAAAFVLHRGSSSTDHLGSVDTAFKLLGSNHKISLDVYDDPLVAGVSCYVSRAVTGGVSGMLGLAEDKSEMSIACRQVGPISFPEKGLPQQADAFTERMSVLFKELHIVRMVDTKRNALVYLTYSDKLTDGSAKNSVTAVPVSPDQKIPLQK